MLLLGVSCTSTSYPAPPHLTPPNPIASHIPYPISHIPYLTCHSVPTPPSRTGVPHHSCGCTYGWPAAFADRGGGLAECGHARGDLRGDIRGDIRGGARGREQRFVCPPVRAPPFAAWPNYACCSQASRIRRHRAMEAWRDTWFQDAVAG